MITNNLVASLKKFGIRAAAYKRPPIGGDVFALTILPKHREGVVTVNQGLARTKVYGNKKMRQAAVTVIEPPRTVTRTVTYVRRYEGKPPGVKVAFSVLKSQFPVIMPSRCAWSVTNLTIKKLPFSEQDIRGNEARKQNNETLLNPQYKVSGTVTARVGKRTVNHFLIGIDETRNFIAPLKRAATSVMMAHRLLKPAAAKELRSKALRQGEWFFVPATRDEARMLENIASDRIKSIRLGKTTHTAKSAIVLKGAKSKSKKAALKGKLLATIFARGLITDSRKGHHKALFLTKWCKVVRNKEVEIKVNKHQKKAAVRRRQTWD